MLNLLHVYYEPLPSGQTTHILSLARRLDSKLYRQTVVLPDWLKTSIAAFQQTGVEVVPLPLRKFWWPPHAVAALAGLVRRGKADLVHVHSQEAGLAARVIVRLAGARRVLYTPQTIDIRQVRWQRLYMWAECALAQITDVIVSVNEADRQRLIGWGVPAGKVVTVPNGIDLEACVASVDGLAWRRQLGVEAQGPLVMQVGRLSPQKDPLAFVEGAAQVMRTHPEAQFVLVGEGSLAQELAERIGVLGLERKVRLAGWQPQAAHAMAAAQVVTLTSRWEGTPFSLLEAMANARPVVATKVNGCPEIVEEGVTGFLTPPGDWAAWAGRVSDLLGDPQRAMAMGRLGRERVETEFSWPKMVARLQALYLGLAETAPGRGAEG